MRMNCSLNMAVSSLSSRAASSWLARITATSLTPFLLLFTSGPAVSGSAEERHAATVIAAHVIVKFTGDAWPATPNVCVDHLAKSSSSGRALNHSRCQSSPDGTSPFSEGPFMWKYWRCLRASLALKGYNKS